MAEKKGQCAGCQPSTPGCCGEELCSDFFVVVFSSLSLSYVSLYMSHICCWGPSPGHYCPVCLLFLATLVHCIVFSLLLNHLLSLI